MNEKMLEKVKLLPLHPGVYIMKNSEGEVIYVGKAKKLRNRVKSYFDGSSKTVKTYALVSNIVDFEYILTNSELDAFSLESNLIKKYKPKYNILLKDDKSFPFIKIDMKERFPRVQVVRRPKKDGSLLFGPYVTGIRISQIMNLIKWAYPIRWCNTNFNDGKMKKRPCLHGEIGNCIAPCAYKTREEEYMQTIQSVVAFLNGDNRDIKQRLKERMNIFAERMQFEEALEVRNLLESLEIMDSELITSLTNDSSIDVFAFNASDELNVINVMKIRGGKNIGQFNYLLEEAVGTESELISGFIGSYYNEQAELPKEVLLQSIMSEEAGLVEGFLQEKFDKKVKVLLPLKGIKKQLVDNASENAKEFATNSKDKYERQKKLTTDALKELAEIVGVNRINRIEGYDISNISGTNSVASMVVFENGEPAKKEYRKFKIRTVEGANDFASMEETLKRRVENLREMQKNFDKRPDLILIDGGLGQLHSAENAIKSQGVFIPVISIAKQDEEIFVSGSNIPIKLERNNYALRLLQRVRDESH
ncbi:MAG: excinuclease ABC subunit UvrC, partial [Clostridia bacterium]|nr:excinuclease ABC subunit UvrC [Clostridia bacterium]